MKISSQILKLCLWITCISTVLVACSVEKKPIETPEAIETVEDKNPEIKVPDEIIPPILQPDEVDEPQIIEAVMPKPKPPLSTKQLFADTLGSHNRVRAKHGLTPLKWSDKLAKYSQQWANHLGRGKSCTMYHRSGTPPYGENLYLSSATIWNDGKKEIGRERNRVTISDVVKVWANEENWYNYRANSCQPGRRCGHYTQIVWRDTTEVGCAVTYCADQSQNWVCSYNPPGNYTGKRPY